jgi:tetratricopeptide (TPR) repeat protein
LRCGGQQALEGMNSADVWEMFIRKQTSSKAQSYCDYLYQDCGATYVGEATVLLCHTWHYKFLDVVRAVLNLFDNARHTIVWLDLFSGNHHRQPLIPVDWLCGPYRMAMSQFNRVVLVLAPWQTPIPLGRMWCLWEIYCAIVDRSSPITLEVAMTGKGTKAFLKSLFTSIRDMHAAISTVNVLSAGVSNEDHYRAILAAVDSCGGADAFNEKVKSIFFNWLYSVALDLSASMCAGVTASGTSEKTPTPAEEKYHLPLDSLTADVYCLLESSNNYQQADSLLSNELSIRRKLYGPNHYRTLHVRSLIARCWMATGELDLAFECYKELLAVYSSKKDADYKTEILDVLYQLAVVYRLRNNAKSAVPILQKVVKKRVALLGWNHASSQEAVDCLALSFEDMGNWKDAQKWRSQCVDAAAEEFGDEDVHTAEAKALLARSLMNVGSRTSTHDALSLYRDCVETHRRALGVVHETTLGWMCEYALMLSRAGRPDKAKSLYSAAYSGYVRLLGDHHPLTEDVSTVLKQLRSNEQPVQKDEEKPEEARHPQPKRNHRNGTVGAKHAHSAKKNLTPAEEMLTLAAGEAKETPAITPQGVLLSPIGSMNEVQAVLDALNVHIVDAERMYRKVLREKKEKLPESDPSTLTSMHSLASILHFSGNLNEAEFLFRKVAKLKNRHLSPSHASSIKSSWQLAEVLMDKCEYAQAIELYREVITQQTRISSGDDASVVSCKYSLAQAIMAHYISGSGAADDDAEVMEQELHVAMELLQDVLSFRTEHSGANHSSTLSCLVAVADLLQHGGRFEDCIEYRREVLQRSSETLGKNNPSTLAWMQDLAMTLYTFSCSKTIASEGRAGPKHRDDDDNIRTQTILAASMAEAEDILNEVIARRTDLFGSSHPATMDAIDCLSRVIGEEREYELG